MLYTVIISASARPLWQCIACGTVQFVHCTECGTQGAAARRSIRALYTMVMIALILSPVVPRKCDAYHLQHTTEKQQHIHHTV